MQDDYVEREVIALDAKAMEVDETAYVKMKPVQEGVVGYYLDSKHFVDRKVFPCDINENLSVSSAK